MNLSWMKLDVNILNDSKIKIIRKYPDGNSLFVLWIGLLCLAMKSDVAGYIYIAHGMPYTAADLSSEFDIELKTVEMGLELFRRLGMIDNTEGNMIEICNFNKHQNIDNIEKLRLQNRERVKRFRNKQCNALLTHYTPITNDDVTQQIRLDKNREEKKKKRERILPSTVDEVIEYIKLKNLNVDADTFWNYYTESGWKDKDGKNVNNYKLKLITWSGRNNKSSYDKSFDNEHLPPRKGSRATGEELRRLEAVRERQDREAEERRKNGY